MLCHAKKQKANFNTNFIPSHWKQRLARWKFDAITFSEFRVVQFLWIQIIRSPKLNDSVWHLDCPLLFRPLLYHSKGTSIHLPLPGEDCPHRLNCTSSRETSGLSTPSFLSFCLIQLSPTTEFKTTLKHCDILISLHDIYCRFSFIKYVILCL